jgi:hypothetical protein
MHRHADAKRADNQRDQAHQAQAPRGAVEAAPNRGMNLAKVRNPAFVEARFEHAAGLGDSDSVRR